MEVTWRTPKVISLLLGESVGYTELGLVGHWVASWQRARVEG